ncbi:protein Mdm4 isoform X1 [Megalops cyprinoides]|uniref:protein Mdm4 isoform X1 n=1 Tax=Megalops cyprinoides TaxID=118141 RepID=UPI00186534E9|nr:protein Mdm4 isoform X1 [Megalops cyprinoides]
MTTLSTPSQYSGSSSTCRLLPGDGSQVQPKAPLLHILRVAGAQEETFTLKEVMHYLGQYIMVKQLYDKQRQHIVHCQDDPLGELLEVESFSVKNPSPVYEMLKKNLIALNCTDAAKNLSVDKDSNETASEDPGQTSSSLCKLGQALGFTGSSGSAAQTTSQRRQREPDEDSLDGLPRSACKRPKLDVNLDEWDLSGLPWWFLGNLRNNYGRRSNGSTDIHTNQLSPGQDEDTAIVSDTTDDLWFLNEAESEQVSVEMKEAALEQGSDGELQQEEEDGAKASREDKEMQEEPDEDSQCLSDDTDTEISTQDAWQCTECRKYNTPMQRYCVRCWALRKDWYKDCPRLVHSISVPDIPASDSGQQEDGEDDGIDVPDCRRTVSDPVILPSHSTRDRPLPPAAGGRGKGKGRLPPHHLPDPEPGSSEGDSQDTLDMETDYRQEALLEPCKLCRVRPRNGNIIHGRTAHLLTCFSCARKLHKFHAPCPGCGQIIQKVIKTFIA